MAHHIRQILVQPEQLNDAVLRLGQEITRDYAGKDLHLLGVLRGSVVFMGQLVPHIDLPVTMDFIGLTSYASPSKSGIARITKDLDESILNRDVLVIEGIVDTGLTLSYVLRNLQTRQPASLRVCTLLNKPARRIIDMPIAYVGFEIPDEFVVGFGLDWKQQYRNLPFIGVLDEGSLVERE